MAELTVRLQMTARDGIVQTSFGEMTKSKNGRFKKMKFLKGQLELNFRIEHTDPVVHQINDVTCIHFLQCLF